MRGERVSALRRLLIIGALTGALLTGGGVLAANPHSGGSTGQPDMSCQSFLQNPNDPLNVAGFNTSGFNDIATGQYAGSQPQNSNNPQSVSQYDVACFQQSTR